MTSIIKITCNESNNIFIASTINIKQYMKNLRKFVRRDNQYHLTHSRKKSKSENKLSDNLSYEILLDVKDKNNVEKIKEDTIAKYPQCINYRK